MSQLGLRSWLLLVLVVCTACTGGTADNDEVPAANEAFDAILSVTSPDGQLQVDVGTDEAGRPRFRSARLTSDGLPAPVLLDSTLGLELTIDDTPVSYASGGSFTVLDPPATVRSSFSLPTGKALVEQIEAEVASLAYTTTTDRPLIVDIWVSDVGFAFRYGLDSANDRRGLTRLEWERTSFHVPPEARSWLQAHDPPGFVTPAYERLRSREALAGSPGTAPYGWTFPSLFATDDSWTLITESAPGPNDAGSHLSSVTADGEFFVDLADRGEGNGVGDPRPMLTLPWRSPWRIVMNSADVGDIVESNLVRHLSEPDVARPMDWVRPGRVSWSWLSDHSSSTDPESLERFIDLASDLGWEYSLVDANWNTFGDDRLAELVEYAARRNVELLLWYNSGGPNNAVPEAPRDRMREETIRRSEFARLAELGIAGIKVDFFHSDKPDAINLYRSILADAADAELLVNFHGSTVPRGWSREFPNLMTMEAVRGAEIYTFDAGYAAAAPRQNTVLPFTRNVVGSMDYTPVILGDTVRRVTTNGHELGLAVIFESGLQHFADTPEAYLGQPEPVVDLLRSVPTVWDETRFIDGAPESHVVLARRRSGQWWIGAISAGEDSLEVTVDLDALGVDPGAAMTSVCDNPAWDGDPGRSATWDDPAQYDIDGGPVDQRLAITLVPNGGCLIRFEVAVG